jgi:hypothetical protein
MATIIPAQIVAQPQLGSPRRHIADMANRDAAVFVDFKIATSITRTLR